MNAFSKSLVIGMLKGKMFSSGLMKISNSFGWLSLLACDQFGCRNVDNG